MKKTNKPNPLKVFNDNRAKAYKQAGGAMKTYQKNLRKAQNGGQSADIDPDYLAWKQQQEAAAKKKRDTEFTPGQQGKFMGTGITKIPYDLWQMGAKSPMSKYYKENPNSTKKYIYDEDGVPTKAQDPNERFGYFGADQQKWMKAYKDQENFESTLPKGIQNMLPDKGYYDENEYKKGGLTRKKTIMKKGGPVKRKMQNGGTTATRGKTKYEYGNTPYTPGGPNQVFVNKTKTKKSGKTVSTNATNELTNSGFKTTIKKTTTDKSGKSKTKDIKGTGSNFNKLLRQGQRATELQRSKTKVKVGGSIKRKK